MSILPEKMEAPIGQAAGKVADAATQTAQSASSPVTDALNDLAKALTPDELIETTRPSVFLNDVRVYVAGVLMPCSNVTVTSGSGQLPEATITLPAYPELYAIGRMDRVPVHIFVRESVVGSRKFILLFEGVIAAKQYLCLASQREINFTAVSWAAILEDVRLEFLTELESVMQRCLAGEVDKSLAGWEWGKQFPLMLFLYGLGSPSKGKDGQTLAEPIKAPSEYLQNIYEFIQQSDEKIAEHVKTFNSSALAAYYKKYADGLRLGQRFEMLPFFDKPYEPDPEEKTEEEKKAEKEGKGAESGAADQKSEPQTAWQLAKISEDQAVMFPMVYGMQVHSALAKLHVQGTAESKKKYSMSELLKFLVDEMEYEYQVFANPAYHSVDPDKKKEQEEAKKQGNAQSQNQTSGQASGQPQSQAREGSDQNAQAAAGQNADKKGEEEKDRLIASALKPLLFDSLPPGCNVMYRSQVLRIETNEQYIGIPTRVRVRDMHGALALLTSGVTNSVLAQFGLIDYYPSEKYADFDRSGLAMDKRAIGSELLPTESHTGPWVAEVGAPRWFSYIRPEDMPTAEQKASSLKEFKRRFCHRQLLNAQYLPRTLRTTSMFNPYITPGFPGVVFDSADVGFAFAGFVLTVTHTFTPDSATTDVEMNFVRMLDEAIGVEIPNPLDAVATVTHDKRYLAPVYRSLLGTEKVKDIQGAEPITYKALWENNMGTYTDQSHPQNNPNMAYERQRRNIVTFEDYCTFMGFTVSKRGNGPDGSKTPLVLDGDFLTDRKTLKFYRVKSKKEEVKKEEAAKPDASKEGQEAQLKPASAATSSIIAPSASTAAKPKAEQSKSEKATEDKKSETEERFADVRDMLQLIARVGFSRRPYA